MTTHAFPVFVVTDNLLYLIFGQWLRIHRQPPIFIRNIACKNSCVWGRPISKPLKYFHSILFIKKLAIDLGLCCHQSIKSGYKALRKTTCLKMLPVTLLLRYFSRKFNKKAVDIEMFTPSTLRRWVLSLSKKINQTTEWIFFTMNFENMLLCFQISILQFRNLFSQLLLKQMRRRCKGRAHEQEGTQKYYLFFHALSALYNAVSVETNEDHTSNKNKKAYSKIQNTFFNTYWLQIFA